MVDSNNDLDSVIKFDTKIMEELKWKPGATSLDITSFINQYKIEGYNRYTFLFPKQNFLHCQISVVDKVIDGTERYYPSVYNTLTENLSASIFFEFIYINKRYIKCK